MLIQVSNSFEKLNEIKELFKKKGKPSSSKRGKDMVIQGDESTSSSSESNISKYPPWKILIHPPTPQDKTPPQYPQKTPPQSP